MSGGPATPGLHSLDFDRSSCRVHDQSCPLALVVIACAVEAGVFARTPFAQNRDFPVIQQTLEGGWLQAQGVGHQRAIDFDGTFGTKGNVDWLTQD